MTTPTTTCPDLRLRRLWTPERVRALCLYLAPDGGGQAELAYRTGLSPSAVSRLCSSASRKPHHLTARALDRVARNVAFVPPVSRPPAPPQ